MSTRTKKAEAKEPNRVFNGDHVIVGDLFKLEVESFLRNISFNPKQPIKEPVEHCHFYHTFDSAGRPMTKCNSIGGHYHDIKISTDSDGNLVGECSTPKRNPQSEQAYPGDNHTHVVRYIKSEKFEARKTNKEAMQSYSSFIGGFSKAK